MWFLSNFERVESSCYGSFIFRHDGFAAPYSNDNRQAHVNHVAEHVRAGTGTGRYNGVPGTRHSFPYRDYGYH